MDGRPTPSGQAGPGDPPAPGVPTGGTSRHYEYLATGTLGDLQPQRSSPAPLRLPPRTLPPNVEFSHLRCFLRPPFVACFVPCFVAGPGTTIGLSDDATGTLLRPGHPPIPIPIPAALHRQAGEPRAERAPSKDDCALGAQRCFALRATNYTRRRLAICACGA